MGVQSINAGLKNNPKPKTIYLYYKSTNVSRWPPLKHEWVPPLKHGWSNIDGMENMCDDYIWGWHTKKLEHDMEHCTILYNICICMYTKYKHLL